MQVEVVWEKPMQNSFTTGTRRLVKVDEDYFLISSVATAFDTGRGETLVFPGDPEDDSGIKNYTDIAGGIGMTTDEAQADLLDVLQGKPRKKRTPLFDPEGLLGPVGGLLGNLMDEWEKEQ